MGSECPLDEGWADLRVADGVVGRLLPLAERKEGEGRGELPGPKDVEELEWFRSSLRACGGTLAARLRSVSGGPIVEDLVKPEVRSVCRGQFEVGVLELCRG